MFEQKHELSVVTAVLPNSTANRVVESAVAEEGSTALLWKARGTLLHDHWLKRWLPPIGPVKSMLQLLVPQAEVDRLVSTIVEKGKLHHQATGAVFSTPAEHVYLGSEFQAWPSRAVASSSGRGQHAMRENLNVIYAIVAPEASDRVSKAAIKAGAHGPIIYYGEGKGLRDRLGWLRITKEPVKEVLMVITDKADVEEIFDAMAQAGELHLPGRGFMYRLSIDKGMFNLPSRISHHHYAANMQQIIHAIDHLSGHSHWRDQTSFDIGGQGRGAGLDFLKASAVQLDHQICLTAVVKRDDIHDLMTLLLNAGAPGLNVSYARLFSKTEADHIAGARINEEYGMLRCIVDESLGQQLCHAIEANAEGQGLRDICVTVTNVGRVATYVPTTKDYRVSDENMAEAI